jgi:enoyl-[acyl-carrier-protein] reductase (NADH)
VAKSQLSYGIGGNFRAEYADIANAALSLASDASRMGTGQILPVDSGVTIS